MVAGVVGAAGDGAEFNGETEGVGWFGRGCSAAGCRRTRVVGPFPPSCKLPHRRYGKICGAREFPEVPLEKFAAHPIGQPGRRNVRRTAGSGRGRSIGQASNSHGQFLD